MKTHSKKVAFDQLMAQIQSCERCQRLKGRTRVFSHRNGSLDARVLFVAEAPGRLGADQTGIPLCGDQTGRNFEMLLASVNWKREDVFITNAILCNPRDESGNNDKPQKAEICNCVRFLERTIEIVEPRIVVSLGKQALNALAVIEQHHLKLRENVGQDFAWNGIHLMPLYHPSQQVCNIHRNLKLQQEDFWRLRDLLARF
ncbi:uracil-DNA glycosylase [Propionispora vibrioides]|uniref:DNA polymerase n=1 Tax=Propionispora vibrioides TaxID=112903 RepID=A0A1H8XQ81_9FIRM|nr:uracil-DNA glycosylase [Propionispora vibrioides]SEP41977.1 DNA polymerase [Propionispora vibrioides]